MSSQPQPNQQASDETAAVTLFAVLSLHEWPPPVTAVMLSQSVRGLQLVVLGVPDGSLGIRVVKAGKPLDYETDMIVAPAGFAAVLAIVFGPGVFSVEINQQKLAAAPFRCLRKRVLCLNSPPPPRAPTPVLSQHVPATAGPAETLFIRTLGDLQAATETKDWYLLLKSSGELRLLLLDGLLHRANERHKAGVVFRVPPQDRPPIKPDKHWRHVARFSDVVQFETLGLDAFLRFKVLESTAGDITVRDVIRAAANAAGGVHFGKPGSPAEDLVLELDKTTTIMGHAVSHRLLGEICKVTVEACAPLVLQIQRS